MPATFKITSRNVGKYKAAQTRIAELEAALLEAADQIDIALSLSQIKEQESAYGNFGIMRTKRIDIKPTPMGNKYRAIAKGENNESK